MDNFERTFNKLYPKTVSRRIKLIAQAHEQIERLEKEKLAIPDNFRRHKELAKWKTVAALLQNKAPMEEIDKIVLSDIFPNISLTPQ